MKGIIPLLTGALIAAFVLSSKKKKPAPGVPNGEPEPRKCPLIGSKYLLIGDSLGEGLRPHLVKVGKEAGCDVRIDSLVYAGAHVTEFTEQRMKELFAPNGYTHVLISLGGNDFQRTDPERVREAINRLVFQIRAAGPLPLWIEPPIMPREDPQVRAWWRDSGVASWFSTPSVTELEQYRAPDKIHYTPAGYRLLAELVWPWAAQYMTTGQA